MGDPAMHSVLHALGVAGSMAWTILWPLVFGFAISAVIQSVVRKSAITRALGGDGPRELVLATGFGMASSSCSYAAVALARSLFRRGASFVSAMAFEIASTNMVIELGVVLALLMGWQFTLAEFVGGPLIIVLVAVVFRIVLRERVISAARAQADKGVAGSMEGHAGMDMSVDSDETFLRRLFSRKAFTAVSNIFAMEWAAIYKDIIAGVLVAGAVAAWVPDSVWRALFFEDHPLVSAIWGPIVGPLVAVVSFVCSVGNVPLAVVLWTGGISFGGVIAFIFADLLIAPILNIYRKYYGTAMTVRIVGTFYVAIVLASWIVDAVFSALGLVPDPSSARIPDEGISWNYTTWLNLVALALAAVLVTRFVRGGGLPMLAHMGGEPSRGES
ncbi:permease [Rhodococcoides kroppenstedtii]